MKKRRGESEGERERGTDGEKERKTERKRAKERGTEIYLKSWLVFLNIFFVRNFSGFSRSYKTSSLV